MIDKFMRSLVPHYNLMVKGFDPGDGYWDLHDMWSVSMWRLWTENHTIAMRLMLMWAFVGHLEGP